MPTAYAVPLWELPYDSQMVGEASGYQVGVATDGMPGSALLDPRRGSSSLRRILCGICGFGTCHTRLTRGEQEP